MCIRCGRSTPFVWNSSGMRGGVVVNANLSTGLSHIIRVVTRPAAFVATQHLRMAQAAVGIGDAVDVCVCAPRITLVSLSVFPAALVTCCAPLDPPQTARNGGAADAANHLFATEFLQI